MLCVDQVGCEECGLCELVCYVYNDQILCLVLCWVCDYLLVECVEWCLVGCFQIVNLWCLFGYLVQCVLLVLLDVCSLVFDDLVVSDLVYCDKVGEIYLVKFNLEYCWYYYLYLLLEEVLLLKIYDLWEDVQVCFGVYIVFDDFCILVDVLLWQSIELCCLLFFDE